MPQKSGPFSVLMVAKNKLLSKSPLPYPQDTFLSCHFREPIFPCLPTAMNRFEEYNVVSWNILFTSTKKMGSLFSILTCICLCFQISFLTFNSLRIFCLDLRCSLNHFINCNALHIFLCELHPKWFWTIFSAFQFTLKISIAFIIFNTNTDMIA